MAWTHNKENMYMKEERESKRSGLNISGVHKKSKYIMKVRIIST